MAPPLPVEVWAQIVSYLPGRDAVKLRNLNHLFYALAQGIQYKDLQMTYSLTRRNVAVFRHMKEVPSTARYSESLIVNIGAFTALQFSRPRWKIHLASSLRQLRQVFGHTKERSYSATTRKSACEVFDILLDAVEHMDKVRHLRVVLYPLVSTRNFQPYESKLWELLSERVTTLSVDHLPPKDADLFSATYKDLSRLKCLSLQLYARYRDTWSEASCSKVARLLNSVKGTLQSLTLSISGSNSLAPFSFIFSKLDRFERLERIVLVLNINDVSACSMVKFLNLQARHLQELSIGLSWMSSEVTFLSSLELPRLRTLQLSLGVMSDLQNLGFWDGVIRLQLTELIISANVFPNEIRIFCDAFRRSGVGHSLRRLSLQVWMFNEAALDALVITFPALQTLSVRFEEAFDPQGNGVPVFDIQGQKLSRQYPDWPLYDLTIAQLKRPLGDYVPRYHAMKTVAASVPSIRSFCGNGHMDRPARCFD